MPVVCVDYTQQKDVEFSNITITGFPNLFLACSDFSMIHLSYIFQRYLFAITQFVNQLCSSNTRGIA